MAPVTAGRDIQLPISFTPSKLVLRESSHRKLGVVHGHTGVSLARHEKWEWGEIALPINNSYTNWCNLKGTRLAGKMDKLDF